MRRRIVGLPRSRTAWFSVWLNAFGCPAIHELLAHVDDLDAYDRALDTYADCCTYGGLTSSIRFDRTVVIARDPADVVLSLGDRGVEPSFDLKKLLQATAALPGKFVEFDRINETLPEIHRYLELPVPYDAFLSERLTALQVEMNVIELHERGDRFLRNLLEYNARDHAGTLPGGSRCLRRPNEPIPPEET